MVPVTNMRFVSADLRMILLSCCCGNLKSRAEARQSSEFLSLLRISEFLVLMAEFDRNSESFFLGHFGSFLAHFRSFGAILGSLFGPLGSFWVLTLQHLVTAGGFFFFFCRKCRIYAFFLSRMS